jgi:GWxTD domain-containing protein
VLPVTTLAVLDNLNRRQRISTDNKRLSMSIFHFTIRAALLLFALFCAEPFLAQEKSSHACLEQPNGAKEAIRRLPESARYWLAEDAIYIITPEERCAFLHLNTDEEREQFIEQFWYRRSVDPISLDYDFKTEFYRRIVFANEKYGSKLLAGRNTDRGRLYVIFGPPESVDENSAPAAPYSMRTWHYHYIKRIGENVQIHFEYVTRYDDYVLPDADRDLVGQAEPNPDPFPVTPENIGLRIGPERPPKIRFKDLEALVVTHMVRDQVKFSDRIEFAAATHATTLVRIDIQIPCDTCTQTAAEYPLFVRVSKPSGWVVATSELVMDVAMHDKADCKLTLTAHLDVPVAPGTYQLAIATKNATTGDAGVLRTQINVPTYESLGMKN